MENFHFLFAVVSIGFTLLPHQLLQPCLSLSLQSLCVAGRTCLSYHCIVLSWVTSFTSSPSVHLFEGTEAEERFLESSSCSE